MTHRLTIENEALPRTFHREGPRPEFLRGLRASLPVAAGFVPFALVLGAQAAQKGMSVLELSLMTGLNFAGGSEFAVVDLWSSPPHLLLVAAITLIVNSRHLLMGATLTPYLDGLTRRKRMAVLFLMCDESWAMGLADAKRRAAAGAGTPFSLPYYMGNALSLYFTWVVSTTAGRIVGPVLGDVQVWGLDMAFPAVFLVLLRGMWKGWRPAAPWLVSLVVAACVFLFVPGAWYVAAGAVSGLFAAWIWSGDASK